MPDGRLDQYTLTGNAWTPATGIYNTLTDNGDGTFTLKQKDQTLYNFNQQGLLASVVDRNDNSVALSYSNGLLTTITDASGRNYALSYDGNNHLTSLADPAGRKVLFGYNSAGLLASATDPAGKLPTTATMAISIWFPARMPTITHSSP